MSEELKEPKNRAPLPNFSHLVYDLFEKLDTCVKSPHIPESLRSRKTKIIEQFVQKWRFEIGDNIYPASRLIFPNLDKRHYNIKDFTLIKFILDIFQVPKDSEDTKILRNWKGKYENRMRSNKNDLAQLLTGVIKARRGAVLDRPEISIDRLNELLDTMTRPETKPSDQKKILTEIFNHVDNIELKWFLRILLKRKLMGGMDFTFFRQWHPDAVELLQLVNDLKTVFWELTDRLIPLPEAGRVIRVGRAFRPQLAMRPNRTYDQIATLFDNNFYIEDKLDGERILMHISLNDTTQQHEFKYFSRSGTDYTYLYGSNYEEGAFSPFIKGCFIDLKDDTKEIRSMVLDGEFLVYDNKRNVILPFGALKSASLTRLMEEKNDSEDSQETQVYFVVYDLVFLNGTSFQDKALKVRRNLLNKILANPIPNRIEVIKYTEGHVGSDIEAAMRSAIHDNREGIVVKNPKSKYYIASRNLNWVKIKPEYLEEFGENIDLIILGKRKGLKNAYICGLRESLGNDRYRFLSLARIANGFTGQMYEEIEHSLGSKWVNIRKTQPPYPYIDLGEISSMVDYWVDPKESVVLEIKARSIDIGDGGKRYAAGTTLYNAYCVRIRSDKDFLSCSTFADYKEIKTSKSRHKTEKTHSLMSKRKRTIVTEPILAKQSVSSKSSIFKDYIFYVLSDMLGEKRYSIAQLEALLVENGGRITKNDCVALADGERLVLLSDKITFKVTEYFNKGLNVFRPGFILKCLQLKTIIPLQINDILLADESLIEKVKKNSDRFGDSYTSPIDRKELRMLMKGIPKIKLEHPLKFPLLYNLFKGLKFYIARPCYRSPFLTNVMSPYLLEVIVILGGFLTTDIFQCSFIIVDTSTTFNYSWLTEEATIQDEVGSLRKKLGDDLPIVKGVLDKVPRIVEKEWVFKCIQEGTIVAADGYNYIG
ncbi:DNA ligase [Komagataella phaffii CBS 7435]|uniref:DNA ligase n=1 Tax=Komagataella phaffii (strain ATCC 76273 / CBS 7435 / CECT 11047 / NRRL Y-11430 / Wegner 21-1) TaxID=981350 RepID=F2QVJ6_KOMPC|nr:GQ67_03825T0 [Komagataella phaffii]CAH2449437.1 DNA ligase [Komagataella phaffii CBS 7435]CCA39424.1 DNA ligase [Komagataella phaffii CBS 7435]